MKKANIRDLIEEVFQIIGEENNISDNFNSVDYSKLDSDTRKGFNETLSFKFNERKGIFKTDFQRTINKINKILKKEYNYNKKISNASDFLLLNNKIGTSLKKGKKQSLIKRIKNKLFVKEVKENKSKEEIIYPDFNDNEAVKLDNIFPDSFGLNNKESKVNKKIPKVPFFEDHKKRNISDNPEVLYPDFVNDEKPNDVELPEASVVEETLPIESEVITSSIEENPAVIVEDEELPMETSIVENKISRKPKHLKKDNNQEELKKKLKNDIKQCENILEILSYKTILHESEEQKEYVKNKIAFYRNKLRNLKRQYKKYEEFNLYSHLIIRKNNLLNKLSKLDKNEINNKLISDIETAISYIDSYIEKYNAYKSGNISEDELTTKGNNTYMIVEYVMSERKPKVLKK